MNVLYPFFHVFFPISVLVLTRLDVKLKLDRLAFSIALMLSDLVDKMLMWTAGTSGRSWAHNLFFLAVMGIPFLLAGRYSLARSMWLGIFLHLLLDIPSVPWLFPFVDYDLWAWISPEYSGGFWDWILHGITNPITLVTEIGGTACLFWLISRYKLLSKQGLTTFFSNNSSIKIETRKG